MGGLVSLGSLDLSNNQLSGPIPPELGRLGNLIFLALSNNQLSGEIPTELGGIANLVALFLGGTNQFTGCIPLELGSARVNDFGDTSLPFCGAGESTRGEATTQTPTPQFISDREVLVALYHATDGPNWTNNTNWLSQAPLGEWHGVVTNAGGRVTELLLKGNQLRGELPPELGQLSQLVGLGLRENKLSGGIPAELGNLARLEAIGLGTNQLGGAIPPSWAAS